MRLSLRTAWLAALVLCSLVTAAPATAQDNPRLRWQTITTTHFRFHFEPELRPWAEDLAKHMESVRAAVMRETGQAPAAVVDIYVEDPLNTANGYALSTPTAPMIRYWATPPDPSTELGGYRGWAEILAVHEFAHIAHLTRRQRVPQPWLTEALTLTSQSPMNALPAWVKEGYATLIEGKLTGAGRPHGAHRPAWLRQVALEGALPTYAELDDLARYRGGSNRYLVGSAYLEWLVARTGDSAMVHLWRRQTSKSTRSFEENFRGVFGDNPDVLYGQFVSELTWKAREAERALRAAGVVEGQMVQHLEGYVSGPAISPNGELMAYMLLDPPAFGELRVERFTPRPQTSAEKRAARQYDKDPEDVRPVQKYPRRLTSAATLPAKAGAFYGQPRWMADNERLLVVRTVARADGRIRPELFVWNHKSGALRQVTRQAGIQEADPFADGKRAAALTCGGGSCGVSLVDLETGAVRVLAAGGLDRSFAGVRVSPDGRYIASAQQDGARFNPVLIDVASGEVRRVGPADGASRYRASWDGNDALVVMSEASGLLELERITLDGSTRAVVARMPGGVAHADVTAAGKIYFLAEHARGNDIRVVERSAAVAPMAGPLDVALAPAVRQPGTAVVERFAAGPISAPRPYGTGPLRFKAMIYSATAGDGNIAGGGITVADPQGRLSMDLIGGSHDRGMYDGGRLNVSWRGWRPEFTLQAWTTTHEPSEQRRNGGVGLEPLDLRFTGGQLSTQLARSSTAGRSVYRAGGGVQQLEATTLGGDAITRSMGFAAVDFARAITPTATLALTGNLGGNIAAGSTDGTTWERWIAQGGVSVLVPGMGGVSARGRYGQVTSAAPIVEQFVLGGTLAPYMASDAFSNRIEFLGAPFALLGGDRMAHLSASLDGPLRFYYDFLAAGTGGLGLFTRITGVEIASDLPRINFLPLPDLTVRTGVAHHLNGTARNATIAYLAFLARP
jgi:hypothetical protein